MLHKALQLAGPGDVIVVDHGAYTEAAPWGEMMSRAAKKKGLEGIVIDGMARDSVGISKIKFPVFARGTAIWGTLKKSAGSVNIPIECGGVHVVPGDLIVGDDDGVVVVPQNMVEDVLEKAKARDEREEMLVQRIDAGVITDFMLNYRDEYDSLVESREITELNNV
jgi:4-hydroxy-4-methyl-2-oxoglutarate aldolase